MVFKLMQHASKNLDLVKVVIHHFFFFKQRALMVAKLIHYSEEILLTASQTIADSPYQTAVGKRVNE